MRVSHVKLLLLVVVPRAQSLIDVSRRRTTFRELVHTKKGNHQDMTSVCMCYVRVVNHSLYKALCTGVEHFASLKTKKKFEAQKYVYL